MKKTVLIVGALEMVGGRGTPHWLELNSEQVSARVLGLPKREDINIPIQERMIVELYSK
jgi:small subunit ribosomal protein S4